MRTLLDIIDTTGQPDILTAIIDKAMEQPAIDLKGWQTIKAYSKHKGHSTQFVYKLINQNKVLHVKCPELNNMVLVKDIEHPNPSNAAPL